MEKLQCIVVDDENMGRKLLEENVRQLPFLELVASCKNAFEAMEVLQTQTVDLIFLDIQMPGMLGTQFLQTLKEKPLTILVTAYDHYAVESYELDVVDYLMKPVSIERFSLAAHKALDLFQNKKNKLEASPKAANSELPQEDFFFVNVEYALVRISIPQITHIEGLKDYVKIYLEGERRPILTKLTMKSMEAKVMNHSFMRVHKSFIVNMRKIESIKQQRIKIGTFEIPVSDSHASDLMEKLNFTRPS
ncbi:LytR/AlgR family response regulator transcription factor [Aquirufa ecclesiirivi]|uniref:Response regulator transcription factor n=1 Tax=Aquirufa ecclesiirivi TaxID=2715124 RepID=A0ABT4JIE7_9BACT|nr:LytTR family DNA-binding domain-containing protein [Aquirufa ecclesiirivi]MCZ2471545.1 response regulator transcription factor [Aquirufa ecclesiirivi]MCZ2475733.1 response regulator transcription factor [Aquirufa ecclesiirivi]MDF0693262.1 LytTR family DNA-binding domain-containing protein [Aquirufa ecclesiirivi]NHC49129.1 response regulator transcription factor [Aquirufa ecclesiirivi]